MNTTDDFFSNLRIEDILSLAPAPRGERLPVLRVFLAKYRTFPCIFSCVKVTDDVTFHVPTILNYIRDELKHDITKDWIRRGYNERTKQTFITCQTCDLGRGLVITWDNSLVESDVQNPNSIKADYDEKYFHIVDNIKFYYFREHDAYVQQLSDKFADMTLLKSKSCSLQMICKQQCGYYLTGIKIKKPLITNMALHYGEKFVPIHNKIMSSLNEKESHGIVLLHGVPGSGKTHYIRYLIQEIKDKTLIYVPPDMAQEISSPGFLPFLMKYENAVLIIEDAENIIKDRNDTTTPSQAVANLLNLSDGLLGDAMHQQIIATFNCDLASIDPALLRKGRLIANYEFNKLDIESAKTLSDKLGFGRDSVVEPMTLAEIYNQGDQINKD